MEIAMSMNIGFWGVGIMGAPPYQCRLQGAGLQSQFGRNAGSCGRGQNGFGHGLREDLAVCDVLVTCLTPPEHVRQPSLRPGVFARPDGLRRGPCGVRHHCPRAGRKPGGRSGAAAPMSRPHWQNTACCRPGVKPPFSPAATPRPASGSGPFLRSWANPKTSPASTPPAP